MSDDPHRLSIREGAGDRDDPNEVVLLLDGEIDPHTAPQLQEEVDHVLSADPQRLVLDLEAVRFVDSSGLRVFISIHRRMTDEGHTFVLRRPTETTVRLLQVTGLDTHIEIEV